MSFDISESCNPDKYVHESVAPSEDELTNVVQLLNGKHVIESGFTEAIEDVERHKDYTKLCELLRTKPHTMSREAGRYIAGLLDGTIKPPRKHTRKEVFQERNQAFLDVSFYYGLSCGLKMIHGKGYPIRGSISEELSACHMASLRSDLSAASIEKLWTSRRDYRKSPHYGLIILSLWFERGLAIGLSSKDPLPDEYPEPCHVKAIERAYNALPESDQNRLFKEAQQQWEVIAEFKSEFQPKP